MDSCQIIYDRTTSNILANLITLRNSVIKREKLVKSLEFHQLNGTFPSNLNFNLAPFQFPDAATTAEKENLNQTEAELLQQFKIDLLSNRLNLSKTILDRLLNQLTLDSQKSSIKKRILTEIPTLTSKPNILSELIFTIETQFTAFLAKQSRAASPPKPAEPQTHEPAASNADMEFIRKQISSIQLTMERHMSLTNRNVSLNRQDPRAHRRGSDAISDGWQDQNFQNRRASPYHRRKSRPMESRSQSPSARTQNNRTQRERGNQEKGSRRQPENQHRQPENQHQQPENQQRRKNSTPYRPRKN